MNAKFATNSLTENRVLPRLAHSANPTLHQSIPRALRLTPRASFSQTKPKFRILITAYGLLITPPPRPTPHASSRRIKPHITTLVVRVSSRHLRQSAQSADAGFPESRPAMSLFYLRKPLEFTHEE